MVDLVRSLSLQGRSRRNALLALRTLQQQRADLERADAVYPTDPYPVEPVRLRTSEVPAQR